MLCLVFLVLLLVLESIGEIVEGGGGEKKKMNTSSIDTNSNNVFPTKSYLSNDKGPTDHADKKSLPYGTMDSIEAEKIASAIAAGLIIKTHEPKNELDIATAAAPLLPMTKPLLRGCVRATPYGNCIESSGYAKPNSSDSQSWHQRRFTPRLKFVPEGFDHVYGPSVIKSIDGHNEQQQLKEKQQQQKMSNRTGGEHDEDDDDDEMLRAYQGILYPHHIEEKKEVDTTATTSLSNNRNAEAVDGNEYGSSRTPLDAPVGSLKEKWRLLPYFLQLRSLMRQHIDSFDYFVNFDMKKVVQVGFFIFDRFFYYFLPILFLPHHNFISPPRFYF